MKLFILDKIDYSAAMASAGSTATAAAAAATASSGTASLLTPSQVVRSTSNQKADSGANVQNNSTTNDNVGKDDSKNANQNKRGNNRGKPRRGNKNNNKQGTDDAPTPPAIASEGDNKANEKTSTNNNDAGNNQAKRKKPRNNKNKNNSNNGKKQNHSDDGAGEMDDRKLSPENQVNDNKTAKNGKNKDPSNNTTKKPPKKGGKKKNQRKKFPWRKHVPAGTVDPITLDELVSLPYPPFALRASPPYLPVPVWPPEESLNTDDRNNNSKNSEVAAKERERQLLQEQWGKVITTAEESAEGSQSKNANDGGEASAAVTANSNHVNLFDGRALAYYMVSQQQFIDPLNRRDLDREEILSLDRYLARNGFSDLNVTEAYDTKGVAISTAGATAQTAAGRLEILQQEARVLLNTLFSRGSLPAAGSNSNSNGNRSRSNPLMQQYSNYQAAQGHNQHGRESNYGQHPTRAASNGMFGAEGDTGVYGDEGMVVIDDDMNPSLRGGRDLRPFRAAPRTNRTDSDSQTLWSANRITSQHGGLNAFQEDHFPSLSETAPTSIPAAARAPSSGTSLHASAPVFVPGSGPARETTPQVANAPKKILPPANTLKFITKAVKKTDPKEAQRQFEAREEARRKALLSNLTFGTNPSAWEAVNARPSAFPSAAAQTSTDAQLERNRAFADALGINATSETAVAPRLEGWARPTQPGVGSNMVTYPDALILVAREKMGLLLKLEKKWKTWLEDDRAASLPLNKMDKATRKFVHEYSDFWKLHTESFDAEPKRYIHCVKLLDTSAPYPLLSEASKNWRGPSGTGASWEHAMQQTAGQDTRGGFGVLADLPRGPRASTSEEEPLQGSNARAMGMLSERPKLELKERTLPLELPPFQPPSTDPDEFMDPAELLRRRDARVAEQKRREREREELKQKTLAAAFASDSEEESLGEAGAGSDWEEEEEALYNESDAE